MTAAAVEMGAAMARAVGAFTALREHAAALVDALDGRDDLSEVEAAAFDGVCQALAEITALEEGR